MPERKSTPDGGGDATVKHGSVLEDVAREGARRMLQAALEDEISEHLDRHARLRDEQGHRVVVGNGHAPQRTILTGVGAVQVSRPRVDERGATGRPGYEPFTSGILPRF